jgi:uncharacterized protein HemX
MTVSATTTSPTAATDPTTTRPVAGRRRRPRRLKARDERGEGVISAAIAVLVMAFLGVGMWVAFNATFQHTAKNVDNQVNCIGSASSSSC